MLIRGHCITLTLAVILLLSVMTGHLAAGQNATGGGNSTGGGAAAPGGSAGASGGSAGTTGATGTTGGPGGSHASTLAYSLLTCSLSLILACLL